MMDTHETAAADAAKHKGKGGKARKKPIRCMETGEEFPSITAAAAWVGCSAGGISNALNRCHAAAGRHWVWADRPPEAWQVEVLCPEANAKFESLGEAAAWAACGAEEIAACLAGDADRAGGRKWAFAPTRRKGIEEPVVCIETGETFPDVNSAAAWAGCASPQQIHNVLRGHGSTAGGYHWAVADEPPEAWRIPVICLDDGREFSSIGEAAKLTGCPAKDIAKSLDGTNRLAGGMHWGIRPPRRGPESRKAVICLETGETFPSIAAAAKWASAWTTEIRDALKGNRRTAAGHHWASADEPPEAWRIPVASINGGGRFPSLQAAAEWAGCTASEIADCLAGRADTAGGQAWTFARSGQRSPTRVVICLESGMRFPGATAAATWAECDTRAIRTCLSGRTKTAAGYHWVWADEAPETWRAPVFCAEAGKSFPTLSEAAEWAGCDARDIRDCLIGDAIAAAGRTWSVGDGGRPVICVETGERFASPEAAAKSCGLRTTMINKVLSGEAATTGQLHWAWADEPASRWPVPVTCLEPRRKFKSLGSAAEWAGCEAEEIAACLAGRTEAAGGHRWTLPPSKPGGRKRPVMCLETGRTFPSITEAAAWAQTEPGGIGAAASGRLHTSARRHWVWADSKPESWKVPVRCSESGDVFSSLGEAAEATGCSAAEVADCLVGQAGIEGKHAWTFARTGSKTKKITAAKPVRCMETGGEFPSSKAAAEWAACPPAAISSALNGKAETAGGFHWVRAATPSESWRVPVTCADAQKTFSTLGEAAEWAGEGCTATEVADCLAGRAEKAGGHGWAFQKAKKPANAVVCIDTGDEFPSIAAAAEWAKTDRSCISRAASGQAKTAGGYRWTRA